MRRHQQMEHHRFIAVIGLVLREQRIERLVVRADLAAEDQLLGRRRRVSGKLRGDLLLELLDAQQAGDVEGRSLRRHVHVLHQDLHGQLHLDSSRFLINCPRYCHAAL